MARDPYCRNCGYSLKGLTESSKCPECGQPIIEVLERDPLVVKGRRYASKTIIFGLPLIHVALGPHEDEQYGRARGIIAIGDVATGWLAIGGIARGIFAFGGLALGIVTMGGLSIGLLAMGGGAIGAVAFGGGAVGGIAIGGGAVGIIAQGGGALGYYAQGGGAWGKYVIDWSGAAPEAQAIFGRWSSLSGGAALGSYRWAMTVFGWYLAAAMALAVLMALIAGAAYLRQRHAPQTEFR